jgi:hypothetical protein
LWVQATIAARCRYLLRTSGKEENMKTLISALVIAPLTLIGCAPALEEIEPRAFVEVEEINGVSFEDAVFPIFFTQTRKEAVDIEGEVNDSVAVMIIMASNDPELCEKLTAAVAAEDEFLTELTDIKIVGTTVIRVELNQDEEGFLAGEALTGTTSSDFAPEFGDGDVNISSVALAREGGEDIVEAFSQGFGSLQIEEIGVALSAKVFDRLTFDEANLSEDFTPAAIDAAFSLGVEAAQFCSALSFFLL